MRVCLLIRAHRGVTPGRSRTVMAPGADAVLSTPEEEKTEGRFLWFG